MSSILEKLAEKKMGRLEKKMNEMTKILKEINENLKKILRCLDCQKRRKS